MLLRELYEAPSKKAVLAFGRLNPPTTGHAKLVDAVTSQEGDHYLFLSHTQKPKTDPLDFATKIKFAKQFFPGINIGHQSANTPVAALEMLQGLGYTDIIFVAGSDRVEGFQKLFDTYNDKPDNSGKIPFKFNSIKVISAGERDPDADDVSGMSASKMRALAAQGELESFAQGVPDAKLAKSLYDAVRKGMGVKDTVPAEGVAEVTGDKPFDSMMRTIKKGTAKQKTADRRAEKADSQQRARDAFGPNPAAGLGIRKKPDMPEAAYQGNLGLMELFAFFSKAEKTDPNLVAKVKSLIKQGQDKQVWKIVQDYTGTKLVGKEFESSIAEAIIERACKNKRKSRG